MPIESFRCSDTEALFLGRRIARFCNIEELRIPPGNRLEALQGNRQGLWSIRINDQWRICFRFDNGRALDVEIIDYH